MSQQILVPYDGSEQSEIALQYAVDVFSDDSITVLYAIEPFADHSEAAGYTATRYEQAFEKAEDFLADAVEALPHEDVDTAAVYGRPTHQILRYADRNGIDQIVMGSHGRDGAARLLLGSVAETVLRRAECPVTVVRESDEGVVTDPGEVLVPFDGSTGSRHALTHALTKYPEATVTVLYVIYPPSDVTAAASPPESTASIDNWAGELDDHVQEILETARAVARDEGGTIETATAEGKTEQQIIEYVENHDIDHVVMGSTGRDGLKRLLLGSVAETVVRRAPVSVTVTR